MLVGGFNSFEKYSSNWIIFPNRGENKKYLKPPRLGIKWMPFASLFQSINSLLLTVTQPSKRRVL